MESTINNNFQKVITPIIVSVFAVYLTIGMTLGTLPSFIKYDLKLNGLTVGLVIGLQSLATLLTRAYSGKLTDTKGAKASNHLGIWLIIVTGAIYISAALFSYNGALALGLLLIGRIFHGISESLSVTGALTWGIGLTGTAKSGKVMTWNGIAMYAGIAIGAPLGIWITSTFGLVNVFALIILFSIISRLSTYGLPSLIVNTSNTRIPFYKVVHSIARQGLGLAFSSIGFACISSFIALLFSTNNWGNPSLAFIIFGSTYILTRIFCSSYPDRFGGYKVALVSLCIEIIGQLMIGFSFSGIMAILGCGITGIGFSLIFPSLGVLAIKKVSPEMRGTALGAYAAFFDLSLGLAGPLAGFIAGYCGYPSIYIFGAGSCFLAIVILFFNRER